MKNLAHYADMLAIPLFAALIYYFYNIPHKTTFEYILYLFAITGFFADILFTYLFLRKLKQGKRMLS
jgi:hypothetical protein